MPGRVPPSKNQIRDLTLLVQAHHPLIWIETVEDERVDALLAHVADDLALPLLTWLPHKGMRRADAAPGVASIAGSEDPLQALAFIETADSEMLYHLRGFHRFLDDGKAVARIQEIYRKFARHAGTLVFSAPPTDLPPELVPLFTYLDLEPPSPEAYREYVLVVLKDMGERRHVKIQMTPDDVGELLAHLRGLTFFEVRKLITQAVVEDGVFSRSDLKHVLAAKRRLIQRSGVLEYFPHDGSLDDVAGLSSLKAWLSKRRLAFAEPGRAEQFGIKPPKGLLLLGVQGCGKSLCAKAVANEWRLPLVRLDPSSLYQKYYGESEKNFHRATQTAEALAPIVLWIDEIEKAFGQDERDGGTSGRIFAIFLSWLQEKDAGVFIVATANDISKLPPELLRKGRFDEIFFVDLPGVEARQEIFRVHLKQRARDDSDYDVALLAEAAEGFSGAEIEQAIVSALYSVFSKQGELKTEDILSEIKITRPLSITMGEKVGKLRAWAKDRAVSAD